MPNQHEPPNQSISTGNRRKRKSGLSESNTSAKVIAETSTEGTHDEVDKLQLLFSVVSGECKDFLASLIALDSGLRDRALAVVLNKSALELTEVLLSCPPDVMNEILELAPKVSHELTSEAEGIGFDICDDSEEERAPYDSDDDSSSDSSSSQTDLSIPQERPRMLAPHRRRLAAPVLPGYIQYGPRAFRTWMIISLVVILVEHTVTASVLVPQSNSVLR